MIRAICTSPWKSPLFVSRYPVSVFSTNSYCSSRWEWKETQVSDCVHWTRSSLAVVIFAKLLTADDVTLLQDVCLAWTDVLLMSAEIGRWLCACKYAVKLNREGLRSGGWVCWCAWAFFVGLCKRCPGNLKCQRHHEVDDRNTWTTTIGLQPVENKRIGSEWYLTLQLLKVIFTELIRLIVLMMIFMEIQCKDYWYYSFIIISWRYRSSWYRNNYSSAVWPSGRN